MLRQRVCVVLSACAFVAWASLTRAQGETIAAQNTLTVPAATSPPSLVASDSATSWAGAATAELGWDVVHVRHATEKTTAAIESDNAFIYVRFDAMQREATTTTQRTNNIGSGSDDEVWIDLWPTGSTGFFYQFVATPIGTHFQSSSENTAYEPTWDSAGAVHDGGYTVTMRIPLSAIRGAQGGTAWHGQFVRLIHGSGEEQIWTFGQAQTNPDDLAYSGTLQMPSGVSLHRQQPRLALYGLGAVASAPAGGSTSRSGADLSIPITPTASLYATIHPDFSNVEVDQQTIAPTAFQRSFTEVRPFFTQGAGFYNNLNCDVCSQIQELYTPNIPTPRDGYAIEGQQGRFSFGSFDAIGDARNDLASSLDYTSSDLKWNATLQRVAVTTPTLDDDITTSGISYYDRKHISAYFDYGSDSGTNVLQGDDAQRYDVGGGWGSQTFALFGSARKVGDYYDPVDGFVQHPGIAGYALYSNKIWLMSGDSKLSSISFGGIVDRYTGRSDGFNQTDNEMLLDILTKSAIDLQISTGSDYLRLPDGVFSPVSQNGAVLTYHSGTQQNVGNFGQHGPTGTPTSITYFTGRYGLGRLDTWLRSTTLRAGTRGLLTFELDDTAQWLARGTDNVQWFERAGYTYQFNANSSFVIGVRRATGLPPVPNGGGDCTSVCTNLSFSYHIRAPRDELYVGYGDANTLDTTPQFILKLIYYMGAQKGT